MKRKPVEANYFKEIHSFTRNHPFQWKLLRLVKAILFNGSHFVYWKIFFLVEAIAVKGSCCS